MEIFLYLDTFTDRQSMRNLCLVCQQLLPLAQSILFSAFSNPRDEDSPYKALHRLAIFTATVFRRPLFGSYVKSVDITEPVYISIKRKILTTVRDRGEPGALAEDTVKTLTEAVEKLPFDDNKEMWLAQVRAPERGFLATILIAMTPNLTTLKMTALHDDVKYLVGWTRLSGEMFDGTWSKPLVQLKSLFLDTDEDELVDMLPLLQLPRIEEFIIGGCVSVYETSGRQIAECFGLTGRIGASSMKFRDCSVDAASLGMLLSKSKDVKCFGYSAIETEFVDALEKEDSTGQFTIQELFSVLKREAGQLEELQVDFSLVEQDELGEKDSLEALRMLRKVSIDTTTALNLGFLPSRVEELWITRYEAGLFGEGAVDLLRRIIKVKRRRAFDLQRVVISMDEEHDIYNFFGTRKEWHGSDRVACAFYGRRRAFREKGIELRFEVTGERGELYKLLQKREDEIDAEMYEQNIGWLIDEEKWRLD
jgi:hypothetical protein